MLREIIAKNKTIIQIHKNHKIAPDCWRDVWKFALNEFHLKLIDLTRTGEVSGQKGFRKIYDPLVKDCCSYDSYDDTCESLLRMISNL